MALGQPGWDVDPEGWLALFLAHLPHRHGGRCARLTLRGSDRSGREQAVRPRVGRLKPSTHDRLRRSSRQQFVTPPRSRPGCPPKPMGWSAGVTPTS